LTRQRERSVCKWEIDVNLSWFATVVFNVRLQHCMRLRFQSNYLGWLRLNWSLISSLFNFSYICNKNIHQKIECFLLTQTKVITLKTQTHAVNARWKRLSQLSFMKLVLHKNIPFDCQSLSRWDKSIKFFSWKDYKTFVYKLAKTLLSRFNSIQLSSL